MERFDTDYSYKYIPIPLKKQHKTQLISKIEKMIKRMRWKALELLGKLYSNNNTKTYGFQKIRQAPANEELSNLENDPLPIMKNIKLRKINNSF